MVCSNFLSFQLSRNKWWINANPYIRYLTGLNWPTHSYTRPVTGPPTDFFPSIRTLSRVFVKDCLCQAAGPVLSTLSLWLDLCTDNSDERFSLTKTQMSEVGGVEASLKWKFVYLLIAVNYLFWTINFLLFSI